MSGPFDPHDDPIRRFARRTFPWVAGLVLVGQVVSNREALLSGRVLPVMSVVVWVAFWAWLFFFARRHTRGLDLTDPAQVRRSVGATALEALGFLVVFAAVVAWGAVERGFEPRDLVPLVFPGLMLLAAAFGYVKADRAAAGYQAQQGSRP